MPYSSFINMKKAEVTLIRVQLEHAMKKLTMDTLIEIELNGIYIHIL